MNVNAPDLSPEEERRRSRGLRLLLTTLVVLAFSLGGLLFYNYSRLLSYVSDTLDRREEPFPWDNREHTSVEACVDYAMQWAADCVGIKSLCDEYVTRYMQECLGSESRRSYCQEFTFAETGTARFGTSECAARGVRRHVDDQSCSNAYRAIDGWCQYERDLEAREKAEATAAGEVEANAR